MKKNKQKIIINLIFLAIIGTIFVNSHFLAAWMPITTPTKGITNTAVERKAIF